MRRASSKYTVDTRRGSPFLLSTHHHSALATVYTHGHSVQADVSSPLTRGADKTSLARSMSMGLENKDKSLSSAAPCIHRKLCLESSSHASQAGYKTPTEQQRLSAALAHSSKKANDVPRATTFPAPLILPDDDLALDPKCPPQSLRQWIRLKERNPVTPERRTVYVAASPAAGPGVDFVRTWAIPAGSNSCDVQPPKTTDIAEYLAAFYHGIPVKMLPQEALTFASWDSPPSKGKVSKDAPRYVGLNTSSECIRIRTRASKDRIFARQLNLDDLLDAAISILPNDAYALVLVVNYDLYEGADDEFVCGRAYGGSRVAVVSSARYNPVLDARQGVERAHAWPASHCETYFKTRCESSTSELQPVKKRAKRSHDSDRKTLDPTTSQEDTACGALSVATAAFRALPSFDNLLPTPVLDGLWLGRMCRTAAHELGHCFGMDHCVYYACAMQGSASLKEDARQPPYICPVDLAKMLAATEADPTARYKAIVALCTKHAGVHLFDAFRAWILEMLKDIEN